MKRTKSRMWLCIGLLCLNLAFIWGNSLLPGEASGTISRWVRDLVAWLLPGGDSSADTGHGLLRKIAHFTEFCALGICLRWLFGMLMEKPWKGVFSALLAGVFTACVDETIQCFVPDRGPALKDVGIDTLGVILGVVIISYIHYAKNKSKFLEDNKL